MDAKDLNTLHSNPDNWYFVFFYFAPDDPRILVKKRGRMSGWTPNLARPMALPFLVSLIASVLCCMDFLSHLYISDSLKWVGIVFLIISLVLICSWLADSARYVEKSKKKPFVLRR